VTLWTIPTHDTPEPRTYFNTTCGDAIGPSPILALRNSQVSAPGSARSGWPLERGAVGVSRYCRTAGARWSPVSLLIARWLSERLGAQFIVENRPGAATNIATEAVARAAPDGHTLLTVSATNTVNATLYSNLGFNFIAR
jgi:Tripartite tricarboxylate transporter family receptor